MIRALIAGHLIADVHVAVALHELLQVRLVIPVVVSPVDGVKEFFHMPQDEAGRRLIVIVEVNRADDRLESIAQNGDARPAAGHFSPRPSRM